MEVLRQNGQIEKRATPKVKGYAATCAALLNEARMLKIMAGSGWAPEVIAQGKGFVAQTDLGISEQVTDNDAFRHNCIRLLNELRQRGVRHGDLTSVNLVIRDNKPLAVDWQESHLLTEPAPPKQPWSDSWLLCRTLSDMGRDDRRIVRRWMAVLNALGADRDFGLPLKGKTYLDVGCWEGDHVALAVAEGMQATGLDTDQDILERARLLWTGLSCQFGDALPERAFDVVTCFSTWAYLARDFGRESAEATLRQMIAQAGTLFFETQLASDGPGPSFLPDDAAVKRLLRTNGARIVEPILTLKVDGRIAERTVWRIEP